MKKVLLMAAAALVAISSSAQDFDQTPLLKIQNQDEQLKFTIGARFMADAAGYWTQFTPLHSGATIADARIRTSLSYGEHWYFYADFGFGQGKFSQKNIYLQFAWKNAAEAFQAVKVGYYNDPAGSMANITSIGSYHFISRPGSVQALGVGRLLGVTYKYANDNWFAYQGVFSESLYNRIESGYNGVSVSGRWLYRNLGPSIGGHIGVSARFAHLGGGVTQTTKGSSVLKKSLILSQTMETYVDPDDSFVHANIPWANNVINLNAEGLLFGKNWFVRAEYLHKIVTKSRDSYKIFIAQQDNIDGWGDIDSWMAANPLRTNNFNGAYIEGGYKIFGPDYSYDRNEALLKGWAGQTLEIVGRVNYTNLNDITKGDYYSVGRDQYYPSGYMEDWPYSSSSVGGGRIISTTVGINFAFNKFAAVMLDYTYHNLKRDFLPYDKNTHQIQGRVMFNF